MRNKEMLCPNGCGFYVYEGSEGRDEMAAHLSLDCLGNCPHGYISRTCTECKTAKLHPKKINRAGIGAKIADVLERDLHDGGAWARILDNAGLTKAQRQWADAHVRWTLIDEEDGADLLQDKEALQ